MEIVIGRFRGKKVTMAAHVEGGYSNGGRVKIALLPAAIESRWFKGSPESFMMLDPGVYGTGGGESDEQRKSYKPFFRWQEHRREKLIAAEAKIVEAAKNRYCLDGCKKIESLPI